jgi:hypothetical protein
MDDGAGYRFFIDANCLAVAAILAKVRNDILYPGHPDLPEVDQNCDDTEWMPVIASRGLVVIGRDRRIITRTAELQTYQDLGIRAFWITGDKDLRSWDYLHRIVRWWERIEEIVATKSKGPWFYGLWPGQVSPIVIRERHRTRPSVIVERRPVQAEKNGQLLLRLDAKRSNKPEHTPTSWD